jgi:hypothetical protein
MTRTEARFILEWAVLSANQVDFGLDDLADSPTVMNAIDEIEHMSEEEATQFADEVALEILEENGFPPELLE